jgi:ComF family protein
LVLDASPRAGAFAPFAYCGAVRKAVHRVKYRRDDGAASALGDLLGRRAPLFLRQFDFFVNVPVGRARLASRGFDQAALLARSAARVLGRPYVPGMLVRHKETPPLATLDHSARELTVQDAFAASPSVQGKAVVLVDDVLTTGATAGAARAALERAGAALVFVLCLAHTPKLSQVKAHS